MKKLRIGIVGTGFIADWHFNAFSKLDGVEVAGLSRDFHGDETRVASQRAELARKAAAFGVRAYQGFDEIVRDGSIDALIIGSINPHHRAQILAGLAAGKHLLVEKPVVTELAQLEEIKAAAHASGRVLFPGHNFVYRGAVLRAKQIVASGKLGRLISSSFVSSHTIGDGHAGGWRSKKSLSAGGALMDSGHHLVYQLLHLHGRPVAVQAFTSKLVRTGMECEDTAQVNVQFADGSVGGVMQSWASGHDAGISGIRIIGEKGCLTITDALYVDGTKLDGEVDYAASFEGQARAFVDSIRNDTPPASTLDDARDTLRLIQAAYESAGKGTVVRLGN